MTINDQGRQNGKNPVGAESWRIPSSEFGR